jgi:phosphate acetyltransferase
MEIEGFEGEQGNCFGMSDGAICLHPTSEQLATIAISCCDTFAALMGRDARCAMLSYSTDGSGADSSVDSIRTAVELAKTQRPDLMIDGEFQSDAAISRRVAAKKVKRPSDVAGRADVLIFPDAAACNIGSKLVQLFAKSRSYGPIYQGFALPVLDCSRGDTEERIFDNIALCSAISAYQRTKMGGHA